MITDRTTAPSSTNNSVSREGFGAITKGAVVPAPAITPTANDPTSQLAHPSRRTILRDITGSVGGLSAAALAGVAGLVNAGKFSDTNA